MSIISFPGHDPVNDYFSHGDTFEVLDTVQSTASQNKFEAIGNKSVDAINASGSYESEAAFWETIPTTTPSDPGASAPSSPSSVFWRYTHSTETGNSFSRPEAGVTGGLFRSTGSIADAMSKNEKPSVDQVDKGWNIGRISTRTFVETISDTGTVYTEAEVTGGGSSTWNGWGFSGEYGIYEDGHIEVSGEWRGVYSYAPYIWTRTYSRTTVKIWRVTILSNADLGAMFAPGNYFYVGWKWTSVRTLEMVRPANSIQKVLTQEDSNGSLEKIPIYIGLRVDKFTWPPDRPGNYEDSGYDDKVWDLIDEDDEDPDEDPGNGRWVDINAGNLTTLGGGRWKNQLVVVGHKKLYFGVL